MKKGLLWIALVSGCAGMAQTTTPLFVRIPHLATGDGWRTTVRILGSCAEGCVLDVSMFDPNGQVIETNSETLPASDAYWTRSLSARETGQLVTGWIEVKATPPGSSESVRLCASGLFTNSVLKQEASSSADCGHDMISAVRPVGEVQYFYSHQDGYTSGFALLNAGGVPLTVLLEWRDDTDAIVASRTLQLGPRRQTSFEAREAPGRFGRLLVRPDPTKPLEHFLFQTAIHSLGFQFSAFGSFTQLPLIPR